MKKTLFSLIFTTFCCIHSFAQADKPSSPEPRAKVQVFINNTPLDATKTYSEGYVKQIALRAWLDSTTLQSYRNLEKDVLIQRATISLAKGNRRVASIPWQPGVSIMQLASQARSGDRFVIEVSELSARSKEGTLLRLPPSSQQVFSIPVN